MVTENLLLDFLDKMYLRGENMNFARYHLNEKYNIPPIRAMKIVVQWYLTNKPRLEAVHG